MAGLLFAHEYKINDFISIRIPTVGEVVDNEDAYFEVVCSIIATPYDMMVQLDDIGIDFTKINDFDLFCLTFPHLQTLDTSLVFGDLDFSKFQSTISKQNGNIVWLNPETGAAIDIAIHNQIAAFLRTMLRIDRKVKRPGNEEARKYMIERARVKQKRQRRRQTKKSNLEDQIVALVNTPEFKYDFVTMRELTIYQFYASLFQVCHKIKYDNTMVGYYAGTVKFEDLPEKDRTWIFAT